MEVDPKLLLPLVLMVLVVPFSEASFMIFLSLSWRVFNFSLY